MIAHADLDLGGAVVEVCVARDTFALIDRADFELVAPYTWCVTRSRNTSYAVAYVRGEGRMVLMHRLLLAAPQGLEVDHINGDGLDNRRANLRLCTHVENLRNRSLNRRHSTGYKGVQKCGKWARWAAQIHDSGRPHYLGCFKSPEEAARAYDRAARERWGAFARLNFPQEATA